ncbi:DUF11 domain-containing protein [Novipirellula artificiosorum]|uniref:Large cysteine-rich periplasmic protein OmcB n=1 Tax=Novipirellula artificiosorum TaxID=2528016 RepID=A0A5C6E284_9BACT|nr:DUF11 domain-containing protein [Novipirellula artificiosorum]TWU42594.1 Large cysteine-rich periplasmic protein OmcB precursor [Novipirellula artificiosorum]
MKPFGVRLAAGAVTILLGALAAAQAQKDRGDHKESSWTLNASTQLTHPPAPITGMESTQPQGLLGVAASEMQAGNLSKLNLPDGPLGSIDSKSLPMAEYGAVQQVQFSEPAIDSAPDLAYETASAHIATRSTVAPFVPPTLAGDPMSASEAPGWGLPNDPISVESESPEPMPPTPTDAPDSLSSDPQGMAMAPLGPSAAAYGELPMPDSSPMQELGGEPSMAMPAMAMPSMAVPALSMANVPQDEYVDPLAEVGAAPMSSGQPSNVLRGGPEPMTMSGSAMSGSIAAAPSVNPLPQSAPMETQPMMGQPMPFTPPAAADALPAATSMAAMPMPYAEPSVNQPQYGSAAPLEQPGYPASLPDQRVASAASLPTAMQNSYPPQPLATPIAAQPVAIDPNETLASPGDRRLEGIQAPSIVIQKRAPSEVKVGKPASFVIHVQNVGTVEALDVQVNDRVPQGMRLVDASPAPTLEGDVLIWSLGSMPAGDERTVTMQLVPEQEGELGSVARVTFEAAASVRTVSTRPELKIVQRAPEQVLIGQQLEIEVEVSNPGTGSATGVVVQEDVPNGLEHPKGKQLDNLLGDLAPGEVRHQVLRLRATAPGVIQNTIRLVSDDGLSAEHQVDVEVVAPQLQIGLSGPSLKYLERQATYELQVENTGTADATNVEIVAQLDRGFTFVSTDFEGQYDPSQHAVYWSLANLPKGKGGKVPLTLLPVEEGARKISIEAKGDLGTVAKSEKNIAIESLAELTFQIADSADPIEIGGETTYEIRVANSGSRNDSNVRVQLQLPAGIERVAADGDAQEDGRGGIFFPPKPQLAANSDLVYRVRVRGMTEGTHLVKAIVTSDQAAVPVTKEESTMVYADR